MGELRRVAIEGSTTLAPGREERMEFLVSWMDHTISDLRWFSFRPSSAPSGSTNSRSCWSISTSPPPAKYPFPPTLSSPPPPQLASFEEAIASLEQIQQFLEYNGMSAEADRIFSTVDCNSNKFYGTNQTSWLTLSTHAQQGLQYSVCGVCVGVCACLSVCLSVTT